MARDTAAKSAKSAKQAVQQPGTQPGEQATEQATRQVAGHVTRRVARHAGRWAILPACLMLWGCPEQIGPNPTSTKTGTTNDTTNDTTNVTTNGTTNGTASDPALLPKPAAENGLVVYRGTLSFGGSIVITLDRPAAGKVTIRFEDSPFGLTGAIVGSLSAPPGRSVQSVKGLAADGSNPPPDALIAALPDIELRFGVDNGALRGDIEGVPNIALAQAGEAGGASRTRHPGSARLAGLIHAVNTRSAPALASLVGTYNYMVEAARYPSGSPAPLPGTQLVQVGQLRIDDDGMLTTCPNQEHAVGCKPVRAGDATMGAQLRPADQTRHPGQFEVVDEGVVIGRLFVQDDGGKWNLRMLQQQLVASGQVRIGTWVMQAVTSPMRGGQLDGDWACREAGIDPAMLGLNPPGLNGKIDGTLLSVKDGAMATADMRPVESANLTLNAGFRVDNPSKPATDPARKLPGVAHALWAQVPAPVGTEIVSEQVVLPLAPDVFVYLREVDDAAGGQAESSVWGLCEKPLLKRPPRRPR